MTILQLVQEQNDLKDQLRKVQFEISSIPCYADILAVIDSSDLFTPHADQLADLLIDRDEPMTYVDLDAVFKASGFEYYERHVLACKPDSQAAVNEQAEYYNRNY